MIFPIHCTIKEKCSFMSIIEGSEFEDINSW